MTTKAKKDYIYAVGRRRSSSARVRLYKGDGQTMVNDQPIGQYFSGVINRAKWMKPFEISQLTGKHYATIKVIGGGNIGQLGAVVLGIARTIEKLNSEKYRSPLKKAEKLVWVGKPEERNSLQRGNLTCLKIYRQLSQQELRFHQ